ncbi:hypothetical protein BpHYR1_033049 [Brachionus plicatilis]|uniref:Uncharacterized protein n=1 Tax=Brachionus plicatilis TaxID=10195 RepID=A0A3M7QGF5_BRAPC|nr:hypothetical protein BpHYR1_033049 [Brachionus plicatilis]
MKKLISFTRTLNTLKTRFVGHVDNAINSKLVYAFQKIKIKYQRNHYSKNAYALERSASNQSLMRHFYKKKILNTSFEHRIVVLAQGRCLVQKFGMK